MAPPLEEMDTSVSDEPRPADMNIVLITDLDPATPIYKQMKNIETLLECIESNAELIHSEEGAKADLGELMAIKEQFDTVIEDEKLKDEENEGRFNILTKVQLNFARRFRNIREKLFVIKNTNKRKCEDESSSMSPLDFPMVKLPALDIPKFNGEIEKWYSFKDMFLNLVNDGRVRESDAARKHYLFQALTGDARSIVENLRDSNFETCWQLLVQTYDDPFRRAKAHYYAIFSNKKTGLSLRQRLITWRQHSEGLRAAFRELNLDGFEQLIIASFLEAVDTKPTLRLAWERRVNDLKSGASLNEFFKFVDQESQSSDRAFPLRSSGTQRHGHAAMVTKRMVTCEKCKQVHYLNQCSYFRSMPVAERAEFIRNRKLCAVCFKSNCNGAKKHAAACPLKNIFCKKCRKPHNTLLHDNGESNLVYKSIRSSCPSEKSSENYVKISEVKSNNTINSLCLFNNNVTRDRDPISNYEPLLATVVLRAYRQRANTSIEARAFLDNGSQFNFITKNLVKRLGIETSKTSISVSGIGHGTTHIQHMTEVRISSRYTNFSLKIKCMLVDNILNSMIPNQFFSVDSWNLSPRLHLADPYFNVPAEIDLLLGLDVFWQVLENRTLSFGLNIPKLHETKFGWIIAGSIRTEKTICGTSVFFVQLSNNELLDQIKKFWVIENHENIPITRDDVECERIFTKTTYRQEDGRFVVSLPFKQDPSILGESRSQALKQFFHLERRLQHNEEMKINYVNCMAEYITLGHMRRIDENSVVPNYYLPHHAVVNPTSTTTKQRTVFNASAKTTSGVSLNDILYTGPVVQSELIAILIRFRLHTYVMSADIVKMYRQIRIHPEHTVFQRIFWRDSLLKPVQVYELDTLSFGERPAPYLATRCLNELALKYGDAYPNAKSVILNDFYVDNLLTGSNSLNQARSTQEQVISLLNSAGLPLSKWCSNTPELLSKIDPKSIETKISLNFDQSEAIKTLGMYWIPSDDVFKIWFDRPNVTESKTKRQILSIIASIFDPMGLIGPITVTAKCFMQEIWRSTVDPIVTSSENSTGLINCANPKNKQKSNQKRVHWDDTVSTEILEPWKNFSKHLHQLNNISLPRHIMSNYAKNVVFELHGFADASSRAYGAVIYSRVIDEARNCRVSLLCSKSRVAPLKQISIARLELCAANLLAELIQKLTSILTLSIKIDLIRLWSDSKVTLSWIAAPSYRWNVFVAHRVSNIQSKTENCTWDYVESNLNPADILSRGIHPQDLTADHEWFLGPSWLKNSFNPWSEKISFLPNVNETQERKRTSFFSMPILPFKSDIFDLVGLPDTGKNSVERVFKTGIAKLRKLVAQIVRFRFSTQPYFPKANGSLKVYELAYADNILIKLSQNEYFQDEIKSLLKNELVSAKSSIASLNPYLDQNGILRVGGRIGKAELPFDRRHPIILHPSHKLSDLIILHEHLSHLHAGQRFLNSILRRRYWIIRINGAVSRCLKNCHTCVRFAAKTYQTIMGDLPKARITPSRPFTHTGIDYAGPFSILGKGGRHKVQIKAYIAIFVCFATKGIHLELVSDLTTPTFLAALSRFIGRRGIPAHIHSDNGTTFVGAKRSLAELYSFLNETWPKIEEFAINKGFQWHFIPPRAPHFGGIWEAGVKAVKTHLYKVLDSRLLNFEQYMTLLVEIEACLNSRPLTAESANPNDDLEVLTPGHFLSGGPITALPSPNYSNVPENRLKHWEAVRQMTQLFWKRWTTEYLNTLQQRYKWRTTKGEINLNDLVLIKESDMPPTQWKRGRITELHRGSDGQIRVVTLRTSTGVVKRPITKLIFLPKGN